MKKLIIMCTDVRFASAIVNYCQNNLTENSGLFIESYAGCVGEYAQNYPHALLENVKYHNIDKIYIFLHDDCVYYNHVYGINKNMHINMHYQMRDAITVVSVLSQYDIAFEIITCKLNADHDLITIMDSDYQLNSTTVDAAVIFPASMALDSFSLIDQMGIKYDRYSYYADIDCPNYFGRENILDKMVFDLNIISLQKHHAKKIIFIIDKENKKIEDIFAYFANNYLPIEIRSHCQMLSIQKNQIMYV
jgi:hypothetical protein